MDDRRRIAEALEALATEEIPDELPRRMGLLDALRAEHRAPAAFEGVDVLFVQHHLGPFTLRLSAMVEDGLDMARTWFIDIPYSTNREARAACHGGSPADHTVELFDDPLDPYSEAQLARVLVLMHRLADGVRGRLLVVDDGGYFLRVLHHLLASAPELAHRFEGAAVVEQTTRGHRVVLRSSELIRRLALSVVSVARCDTKIEFESPFIGVAVSRAIATAVRASESSLDLRRAAVLGFGAVGAAVTRALLRAYPAMGIDVVDPDASKHADVERLGARPAARLPERLAEADRYDLVAGCTGYNAFRLHERRLLSTTGVLASGSSAAVEFNRTGFIELADADPNDEIEVLDRERSRAEGIHATVRVRHEGGAVVSFLNAGFPVNFDGRMECLPARVIQATHCLLFHAGRQALAVTSPGVHRFDPAVDAWLLGNAPRALDESWEHGST